MLWADKNCTQKVLEFRETSIEIEEVDKTNQLPFLKYRDSTRVHTLSLPVKALTHYYPQNNIKLK